METDSITRIIVERVQDLREGAAPPYALVVPRELFQQVRDQLQRRAKDLNTTIFLGLRLVPLTNGSVILGEHIGIAETSLDLRAFKKLDEWLTDFPQSAISPNVIQHLFGSIRSQIAMSDRPTPYSVK